ncbi:MAG TPA: hypothetical protein VL461_10800 [Dictyobacter sp.]|jgi:hypothetical protein|nr:hypothetical protein [Dictyobacter sp.]
MMSQRGTDGPRDEQGQMNYSGYGAQQRYEQQQSYEPYGRQQPEFDDNFVEAVADRIARRLQSGPSGKIGGRSGDNGPSSGQRLALAIVSLALLVPISGAVFGILHAWGILAFGLVCLAIIAVNFIFNFRR